MNITNRTTNARQHKTASFQQSEHASLPYTVNYSHISPDTITESTWTGNGATVTGATNTDTATAAFISGSPGTYNVVNKITTDSGAIDERTIKVTILPGGTSAGDYR